MTNLDSYSNIYADLAQSSYQNRNNPKGDIYNFANGLTNDQKKQLNSNKSAEFTFPNAKDAHGNDASTVYLQPDNTVKTVEEKNLFGRTNKYQKGLLTDEEAADICLEILDDILKEL